MSLTRGTLREKLVPGSSSGEPTAAVVSALDGHIREGERVRYRLPGGGDLVKEEDGGTAVVPPAGGDSLAVVTDRKLVFAAVGQDSESVTEIEYTDVRRVDAHDGLLRSKLTVAVWGDGEYRLRIADASELGAAVKYIREASECWDRVVATLEDAYEAIDTMGTHFESGATGAAGDARARAVERIERSRTYLERAEIDPPAALDSRIEAATHELARTEIRTRVSRAGALISEGTHLTEKREYTDASRRLRNARDHLEAALSVAREADIREPPEANAKLEVVDNRLRQLEVKPRALAEQACERAVGTDSLRTEIEAWEEAFGHYRDALTAGWGTDLDFSGETDELRMKTEIAVSELVSCRYQLADRLEREGDELRTAEPDAARERYESALDHCERAHQLAREFRSGDAAQIGRMRTRLRGKRYELASE
jgi:tetratricopeptide (TPR) repeat protein